MGAEASGPQAGQRSSSRGSFRTGLGLARSSWLTLAADLESLWVAAAALVVAAGGVLIHIAVWGGLDAAFSGPVLLVSLKTLPLAAFIHATGMITDGVMVGVARIRLAGGDPSLAEGWRITSRRIPQLVVFGLVHAVQRILTWILRTVFRQPGWWLADLIDAAWDFATFLAVPVIIFERERSVTAAVRRSAQLVRARWGTQLVAMATVGFTVFVLLLPLVLVGGLICWWSLGSTAVWLFVISVFVIGDVITAALFAVLSAAMYRFLHSGRTSPRFSEAQLRSALTVPTRERR